MKGSVFVLKPHNFHDFIGCFGNVMLDKGSLARQVLLSCQESQWGGGIYRDISRVVIHRTSLYSSNTVNTNLFLPLGKIQGVFSDFHSFFIFLIVAQKSFIEDLGRKVHCFKREGKIPVFSWRLFFPFWSHFSYVLIGSEIHSAVCFFHKAFTVFCKGSK